MTVTKSGIVLTYGPNDKREPGRIHYEFHAPCGCAFHERPAPHWHPCPTHTASPPAAVPVAGEREAITARWDSSVGLFTIYEGAAFIASTHDHHVAERIVTALSAAPGLPAPGQRDGLGTSRPFAHQDGIAQCHAAVAKRESFEAAAYRLLRSHQDLFSVSQNIGHDWVTLDGPALDDAIGAVLCERDGPSAPEVKP